MPKPEKRYIGFFAMFVKISLNRNLCGSLPVFAVLLFFMGLPFLSPGDDPGAVEKKSEASPPPPASVEAGEKGKAETEEPDPVSETLQFLLHRKYAPPLSLSDSIRLTENVIALVNPATEKFKGPRKEKAATLLNLISSHVKITDDRLSSLLFYRWYYIGTHRVDTVTIDEDIFLPQPPLRNVSAISFEATGSDVLIHYMKVVDINNHVAEFNLKKWILAGLPRKEVCFLYFPTTIKRIVMDYSTKPDSRARMKLFAGVTDQPEYGKASLYYLSTSRRQVETGDFKGAKENLRKARELLIKFQNRQRR